MKAYDHLNFMRASIIQFLESRYIMGLNHTPMSKVLYAKAGTAAGAGPSAASRRCIIDPSTAATIPRIHPCSHAEDGTLYAACG